MLPAMYQSNFHPTAFLLEKIKGTHTRHSLGKCTALDVEKAERVYCQTVNTCIDFGTKLALEAGWNESPAGGQSAF